MYGPRAPPATCDDFDDDKDADFMEVMYSCSLETMVLNEMAEVRMLLMASGLLDVEQQRRALSAGLYFDDCVCPFAPAVSYKKRKHSLKVSRKHMALNRWNPSLRKELMYNLLAMILL